MMMEKWQRKMKFYVATDCMNLQAPSSSNGSSMNLPPWTNDSSTSVASMTSRVSSTPPQPAIPTFTV